MANSHLKEAAVGIQDGRQVPANIGVHRGLDVNVLKAHFNAWRMDSNPAYNTLFNDWVILQYCPVQTPSPVNLLCMSLNLPTLQSHITL